jgi:hypothetical protein
MAPRRWISSAHGRYSRWALSWLVVFAVGLAPMLIYWVAAVTGRAFWRTG